MWIEDVKDLNERKNILTLLVIEMRIHNKRVIYTIYADYYYIRYSETANSSKINIQIQCNFYLNISVRLLLDKDKNHLNIIWKGKEIKIIEVI